MIENFITLSTFNKGIHTYLSELSLQNAKRDDLWQYLNEAAKADQTLAEDLDLGEIMEGWTVKEGYPVITVSDLTDSTAKLTQKRFFLNSAANASDFKWYVPVSMTCLLYTSPSPRD